MRATATGSLRLDRLLFGLLAAWVLLSAPLLRVYFRATVWEVTWAALAPDGRRRPLPDPPEALWRIGTGALRPEQEVARLERRVRRALQAEAATASPPPGAGIEMRVRYGARRDRLDREHVFTVTPDVGAR